MDRPGPSDARWRGALLGAIGPLALGTTSVVVGYGAYGDLEHDRAGLAPSFRLGLTHGERSANVAGAGTDLAWTTVRAAVCPLRADLGAAVSLRPCAGLDAGVVVTTPRGLQNARPASRPWVTPLLTGRVRWLVTAAFFAEGELGLALPLVRDELAAEPATTLYRAPVLVPLASLAAGVRFP